MKEKVQLPEEVFFVINPEGKSFQDSVSSHQHLCKREFLQTWFSGWEITLTDYECDTLWKAFERRGFRLISVKLPK